MRSVIIVYCFVFMRKGFMIGNSGAMPQADEMISGEE